MANFFSQQLEEKPREVWVGSFFLDRLGEMSNNSPRPSRRTIGCRNKSTSCRARWTCSSSKPVPLGKLHGYGVLLRIQQISGEQLIIQQGSLYPALYRLEHDGAIKSEWGESDNNRRAKYYSLTPAGRRQLTAETENGIAWPVFIGLNLNLTNSNWTDEVSEVQP